MFPLIFLCFFGSGCAALVYEIVWFQLLEFVIGSTAISMAVLLGTFMGGMCLGSLALPRLVKPVWHPLRVCAWLELGIGASGLAVLAGMPALVRLFAEGPSQGPAGIFARGAVCALCLLPPTVLMGATLPAISRWVENTPVGISRLGFFYCGNTLGAVFGSLLAGFYLLRVHDMPSATLTAAAINLLAALLGFGLAARTPHAPGKSRIARGPDPAIDPGGGSAHTGTVHLALGLSGMSALGAEIVWTRLLSLTLGPTVYTFSIILAVFLVGIGMGGSIGAWLSRSWDRPRLFFGLCQLLLAAAIAWTAFAAIRSLPYWPTRISTAANPWPRFRFDFLRCLRAILPAALLWGASFPLALAAIARSGRETGKTVGGAYAANTLGAIAGALGFSLIIVPGLGTRAAERILVGIALAASAVVLVPVIRGAGALFRRAGFLLAAAAAAAWLMSLVPRTSGDLIAYGRTVPQDAGSDDILYVGEGMNSSVAVSESPDGTYNFHVSGKVEASTTPQDMRLQRMLGHLPAMLHPSPRSVLIVGCGAGVTAGSFIVQPGIERIVICEIEPLVPRVVARYFGRENHHVVTDPRVQIVFDDARHYVLTTHEKFDIITSDPIHPWVKGSASLYTREYFQLCKDRLNPGGLVTQWVPLYQSDEPAVRSEIATFFGVFPQGTVWGNDDGGKGYDMVLLGQNGPARVDVDSLAKRWTSEAYRSAAASLAEAGFKSPQSLLATYAGQAAELAPWLAGAEPNTDRNLRLQYLAGLAVDSNLEGDIYRHLLAYCRYPENVFVGSGLSVASLQGLIEAKESGNPE